MLVGCRGGEQDARPDEALMWDIEAQPADPMPLQRYAERLVARRQYARACDYIQRALSTPTAAKSSELQLDLLLRLGTLRALMDDFGAAEKALMQAVSVAKGFKLALPLTALGKLLERMRLYDRAEEAYLRALAADCEHSDALLSFANLLADIRGDHHGASTYYKRALKAARLDLRDANMPLIQARSGFVDVLRCFAIFKSTFLGDHIEALALLAQAAEVPPGKEPSVISELARIQLAIGEIEIEEACDAYETALMLDPDHVGSMMQLASSCRRMESLPETGRAQRICLKRFCRPIRATLWLCLDTRGTLTIRAQDPQGGSKGSTRMPLTPRMPQADSGPILLQGRATLSSHGSPGLPLRTF